MFISKLKIHNYKIFKDITIEMNETVNIFVGENDSGKTTILEALMMCLSGKFNGSSILTKLNSDWFNKEAREQYKKDLATGTPKTLPKIEIEIFLNGLTEHDISFQHYKGTNNSLKEDAVGIRLEIIFNEGYSDTYKQLIKEDRINDIPVELYKIEFSSFAQKEYYIANTIKRIACIDTTKKDYGTVLNKFVSNSISAYLSEDDETTLRLAYRGNRKDFTNSKAVKNLNKKLSEEHKFGDKTLSLNLREGEIDNWKSEMSLSIDDIPFENAGFGTQNMIKSEMVFNQNVDVNFLVLEEPENNLSYTNMSMLISKLVENKTKQVFISTHSSFVANKLGLNYLHLVASQKIQSLKKMSKGTFNYFVKLPGYNTLRLLLANQIILVEGPADELIIQRAYFDTYKKLPIEDGIDVLSVGGTAFKRYCELATLINKVIVIVTDNDHEYKEVVERYEEFAPFIKLFVEQDDTLYTLEPSILSANKDNLDEFKEIIYFGSEKLDYEGLLDFMKQNKSEWAMRIFQSDKKICYPKYIKEAIRVFKNE